MKYLFNAMILILASSALLSQESACTNEYGVTLLGSHGLKTVEIAYDLSLYLTTGSTTQKTIYFGSEDGGRIQIIDLKDSYGIDIYGERPGIYDDLAHISMAGRSEAVYDPSIPSALDGSVCQIIDLENRKDSNSWSLGIYEDIGLPPLYLDDNTHFSFSYKDNLVGAIDETGAYSTLSDERLKTNITSLSTVLPNVLKITPSEYSTIMNPKRKTVGFLAQNLSEFYPEVVQHYKSKQNDKYLVNYSGMIPVLTKAIQEHQLAIEEQSESLARQKELIDSLTKLKEELQSNN